MNLYLRDKEKFREGELAGRAIANQELQMLRERANKELQAEREEQLKRAKKEAIATARSFLGIASPEVIASKFHITVEELMAVPPHDTTPKA